MFSLVLALALVCQQPDNRSTIVYSEEPTIKTEVRPLSGPADPPPVVFDITQNETMRDFGRGVSRFLHEYRKPVVHDTQIVYVPQKETIQSGVPIEVVYVLGGCVAGLFLLLLVVLSKKPLQPAPVVFIDVDHSHRISIPRKPCPKPARIVAIEEKFTPVVKVIGEQEALVAWESGQAEYLTTSDQ
jgi:hypothetical protein